MTHSLAYFRADPAAEAGQRALSGLTRQRRQAVNGKLGREQTPGRAAASLTRKPPRSAGDDAYGAPRLATLRHRKAAAAATTRRGLLLTNGSFSSEFQLEERTGCTGGKP